MLDSFQREFASIRSGEMHDRTKLDSGVAPRNNIVSVLIDVDSPKSSPSLPRQRSKKVVRLFNCFCCIGVASTIFTDPVQTWGQLLAAQLYRSVGRTRHLHLRDA